MKKVFSFFAMIALVGMMVACNGGDKPNKEGVTSKNEIKEGDSDALKMVKITDQLINIMDQEPSAEGYELMMNTSIKMMSMLSSEPSEEEIKKAATDAGFDFEAMEKKMNENQGKWDKWAEEHQEEAQAIALKAFGALMAAMPQDEAAETPAEEPVEAAAEEVVAE